MGQVIVVVPCFNEETRLPSERLLEYVKENARVGLLLVNDGSTDRTGEVLHRLEAQAPGRIKVLELPGNRGKAEAVRVGLSVALGERAVDSLPSQLPGISLPDQPLFPPTSDSPDGAPDFVGFWDADLATPLEEIALFVAELEAHPELDMVFGARVKLLGRSIERKAHRHYFGRVLATLVSYVLELPIYDSQCGAKLFRVSERLREALRVPFSTGWVFDVELLARLKVSYEAEGQVLAKRMLEYPLHAWQDVGGSKVHPEDALVALWNLMRIKQMYLNRGTKKR